MPEWLGTRLRRVTSPIARGAILGAATGFTLSALYGFAVMALLLGAMIIPTSGTPAGDYLIQLSMATVTAGCAIPCVGLLGITPGTLWGLVLGAILGALVAVFQKQIHGVTAALLGAVVSMMLALTLHYLIPFTESIAEPGGIRTYFLYQGAPSLISIGAGGWMGWQLHKAGQAKPDTKQQK